MGHPTNKFDLYLISSVQSGMSFAEDRVGISSQRTSLNSLDTFASTSEQSLSWDDLLSLEQVACVMQLLPSEEILADNIQTIRNGLKKMCRFVQSKNMAFLLENNFTLAAEIGADGVHLSLPISRDAEVVDRARRALGKTAILGMAMDGSRDHAMTSGEAGADYLSFDKNYNNHNDNSFELLEWWCDLFEIPAVAWNLKTRQDVDLAISAGAEFLAIPTENTEALNSLLNTQNSNN